MLVFALRIMKITYFSSLFPNLLGHIDLKICMWLCFNVQQIKFECRHFVSIIKGVMSLLKLRI